MYIYIYIYLYIYIHIYIYVQCKCRRVCSLVLQRALHMYITHTAAHQAADSSALALAWHRGHRVDKSFTSSSRTIPKTTQVSQQGQGRKLKVAIANLRRSPHVHIIVCLVMTSWHSGEKPEMLISSLVALKNQIPSAASGCAGDITSLTVRHRAPGLNTPWAHTYQTEQNKKPSRGSVWATDIL